MKLSEMKLLLEQRDIELTKSLGQNFLHDANQLRRIIDAAELQPGDRVLEIGPGLGPLTELLLTRAAEVLAIEKDRRLVEVLRERFSEQISGQTPAFRLVHADALAYLRTEHQNWHDWKLVANLPYSVASPILVELAQASQPPERMVATLQLEVVRRLAAGADDPDYGLLTLLVQARYEPQAWFKIPATCFFPEPDVDSGCVKLVRRKQPLISEEQIGTFTSIVKRSFSQRRKMMIKLLKEDWPAATLETAFAKLEIQIQTRAESVSVEKFAELTRLLHERRDL